MERGRLSLSCLGQEHRLLDEARPGISGDRRLAAAPPRNRWPRHSPTASRSAVEGFTSARRSKRRGGTAASNLATPSAHSRGASVPNSSGQRSSKSAELGATGAPKPRAIVSTSARSSALCARAAANKSHGGFLSAGWSTCTRSPSTLMRAPRSRSDLNCPLFRPDTRRKQEGSRLSLRTGLCRMTISGSS